MPSSVFHNWAHNVTSAPNSRKAVVQAFIRQGNVFFDPGTRTIYSYGRHFPMARFVTNRQGETAVVFTRCTYSVTTAGHLSGTRRAVSHLRTFLVPSVSDNRIGDGFAEQDWTAAHAAYIEDAHKAFAAAKTARLRATSYRQEGEEFLRTAQDLARFAELDPATLSHFDEAEVDAILAERKEKNAQERAWKKERQEAERIRNAEAFERFLEGNSSYLPDCYRNDPRAAARLFAIAEERKAQTEPEFEAWVRGEDDAYCPTVWYDDPRAVARFSAIAEERKAQTEPEFEAWLRGEDDAHCPTVWYDDPRAAARLFAIAEERKLRDAEKFRAWLNGSDPSHTPPPDYRTDEKGSAYLRTIGEEVQTSQYASVPLAHAIKAYRFVKLCRMAERTYQRNGHSVRVGHFVLESVTATGDVHVGCHFFTWEQLNDWALRQGIAELSATDEALTETTEASA